MSANERNILFKLHATYPRPGMRKSSLSTFFFSVKKQNKVQENKINLNEEVCTAF